MTQDLIFRRAVLSVIEEVLDRADEINARSPGPGLSVREVLLTATHVLLEGPTLAAESRTQPAQGSET